MVIAPTSEAEGHAETDGDVADFRGAFDRVAEESSQRREVRAVGEKADTIAELEDEIGTRQEIGVATAHVQNADQPCRPAFEDRQAVCRRRSGEKRTRAGNRDRGGPWMKRPLAASPMPPVHDQAPPPLCRPEKHIVLRDHGVTGRGLVRCARRSRDDLYARRQHGHRFSAGSYRRTPGYRPRSRELHAGGCGASNFGFKMRKTI